MEHQVTPEVLAAALRCSKKSLLRLDRISGGFLRVFPN